jgi:cell division protein FtsB
MKRTNEYGVRILVAGILSLALVWTVAQCIGINQGKATARETIAQQDKVNIKQAEDNASLELQNQCLKNTNDELIANIKDRDALLRWAAREVAKRGKK